MENRKGRRTQKVGTVISDRMDKTLAVKVERKFSHPIYKKIFEFVDEKLGIKHGYSESEVEEFNKFKALRNIYAHGDGTVTWVYLEKIKDSTLKHSEKVIISEEIRNNLQTRINQLLLKFDKALLNAYPKLSIF